MDKNSKPPVNMIVKRHGNHASVSGYDRISDYIPSCVFRKPRELTLAQRSLTRVLRRWSGGKGSQWYGRQDFLSEMAVAKQWLKRSGQIFHFVYGENSYRYTGQLKRLRANHIVATYHAPPKRFREVVSDRRHMQYLDAAIIVSRVLHDCLAEEIGPERVHFIPHGVDTDFFVPSLHAAGHSAFKCLFVGTHLRDFELLAEVARHFHQSGDDLTLEVISHKGASRFFAGLENVTLRYRISDEALRSAYQEADLLVMPMKDATANNSLLEAMACGLPMVVTDLPGVRDYVDKRCASLIESGNARAFVEAVKGLRKNGAIREAHAIQARKQAVHFSFEKVSAMTEAMYRSVAASEPAGSR